jgi:adenosylhomocysteinase
MGQVRDPALAPNGKTKIEWARAHMPVLGRIGSRLARDRVFENERVGMCLHLEMKTAVLAKILHEAGAEVAITGSNPLSTQDDVAAALDETGVDVYAWYGVSPEDHQRNLLRVLDLHPTVLIDDGAELAIALHKDRPELIEGLAGACEETTTGVIRFRAMEQDGSLRIPVIAVNDARTKFLFDSQYGTGQSALEGIMRATNLLIAGKTVVVAGYGWVSRGIAKRAHGLGAQVVVTEVNPIRALEAAMEGFRVMPMDEAAAVGDLFITGTGCKDIITEEHFRRMKDGAILANSGHYDVEVKVSDLERIAKARRAARHNVDEYTLDNGRHLYLIAKGRLVNLAAADGHPAEVMDMSFANQALSAEYLLKNKGRLESKVHLVPREIDEEVARLWLESHNIRIDTLTDEQKRYLESWEL